MDSSPGFWIYIFANVGFIITSGLLTGLSFLAYRRSDGQRSYAIATLGFGSVLLGGVSELGYTVWFEPEFVLTRSEFLSLQAGEDILIAFGLGLLFYAITQHDTGSAGVDYSSSLAEEDTWTTGHWNDD